jgi:hypothetical protein
MVKNASLRIKKYSGKFDPTVVNSRFTALKQNSIEQMNIAIISSVDLENRVKNLLKDKIDNPFLIFSYLGFAKEIWKLCRTLEGNTLAKEVEIAKEKWRLRGFNPNILDSIINLFGKVMYLTPPTPYPYSKGTLIADGSEQTLVEFIGVGTISGHVDLQKMTDDDIVIIRYYIKLKEDGEYKLYDEETYVGVQTKPVIHFKPITVDVALKITLQQTAGTYKSFDYNFIREG